MSKKSIDAQYLLDMMCADPRDADLNQPSDFEKALPPLEWVVGRRVIKLASQQASEIALEEIKNIVNEEVALGELDLRSGLLSLRLLFQGAAKPKDVSLVQAQALYTNGVIESTTAYVLLCFSLQQHSTNKCSSINDRAHQLGLSQHEALKIIRVRPDGKFATDQELNKLDGVFLKDIKDPNLAGYSCKLVFFLMIP